MEQTTALSHLLKAHPELKNTKFRALLEHWLSVRGQEELPTRSLINPGRMKDALADIVMMNWRAPAELEYRLTGTAAETRLDFNAVGVNILDLIPAESAELMQAFTHLCSIVKCGVYLEYMNQHTDDTFLAESALYLPLADADGNTGYFIGATEGASTRDVTLHGAIKSLVVHFTHIEFVDLGNGLPERPVNFPSKSDIG